MNLPERINALFWLSTPERFGIPLTFSRKEELMIAAMQEDLDYMRRSMEKLKAKLHRIESKDDRA